MTLGIVGHKRGMTRLFTGEGQSIPVTVIEVSPNYVAGLITAESRGYSAVQVAWGRSKPAAVSKAEAGHYAKAGLKAAAGLLEYRVGEEALAQYAAGAELKVDMFAPGQKVDVTGTTHGKGFAGGIKRHNFRHQRNTHGNSLSHRAPGSIGQCQTPGRVFKGKKMAGQMGNVKRTAQNLELVRVDKEHNLLLIKGAVPAARGGRVIVKPAVKVKR